MKLITHIENETHVLITELDMLIDEYNQLGQIEMLSSTGNKLQNKINNIKGQLMAHENTLKIYNNYEK